VQIQVAIGNFSRYLFPDWHLYTPIRDIYMQNPWKLLTDLQDSANQGSRSEGWMFFLRCVCIF